MENCNNNEELGKENEKKSEIGKEKSKKALPNAEELLRQITEEWAKNGDSAISRGLARLNYEMARQPGVTHDHLAAKGMWEIQESIAFNAVVVMLAPWLAGTIAGISSGCMVVVSRAIKKAALEMNKEGAPGKAAESLVELFHLLADWEEGRLDEVPKTSLDAEMNLSLAMENGALKHRVKELEAQLNSKTLKSKTECQN